MAGVLDDVISLSHTLGAPDRDLVILAEGNTSIRTEPDRMLVKASGVHLATAGRADFVDVRISELIELLDDSSTDQHAIAETFNRLGAATGRRPSVEAMLHAICLQEGGASVVGHTHPVAVNALLCSEHAETLASLVIYPEQIVVLGRKAMLIPYVDPGLSLARLVRERLQDFVAAEGVPPKVIYLANHGMFALGTTPDEVLRITEMAVKVSRIMQAGLAMGALSALSASDSDRIHEREDEQYRRAILDGGEHLPVQGRS
jgi:rhamnose utilization protein RhaD (predicted bifunctional aldolase and dehydrogenase)